MKSQLSAHMRKQKTPAHALFGNGIPYSTNTLKSTCARTPFDTRGDVPVKCPARRQLNTANMTPQSHTRQTDTNKTPSISTTQQASTQAGAYWETDASRCRRGDLFQTSEPACGADAAHAKEAFRQTCCASKPGLNRYRA